MPPDPSPTDKRQQAKNNIDDLDDLFGTPAEVWPIHDQQTNSATPAESELFDLFGAPPAPESANNHASVDFDDLFSDLLPTPTSNAMMGNSQSTSSVDVFDFFGDASAKPFTPAMSDQLDTAPAADLFAEDLFKTSDAEVSAQSANTAGMGKQQGKEMFDTFNPFAAFKDEDIPAFREALHAPAAAELANAGAANPFETTEAFFGAPPRDTAKTAATSGDATSDDTAIQIGTHAANTVTRILPIPSLGQATFSSARPQQGAMATAANPFASPPLAAANTNDPSYSPQNQENQEEQQTAVVGGIKEGGGGRGGGEERRGSLGFSKGAKGRQLEQRAGDDQNDILGVSLAESEYCLLLPHI